MIILAVLLYEHPPAEFATASRATLCISDRLAAFQRAGLLPLTTEQPPASRQVGTCRDFALLACALFRHYRIPARVRCGFAQYFHPPTYEDHWICEYWSESDTAWMQMDAQLDAVHCTHLSISFDPLLLPKGQFLAPWQVWSAHRADLGAFGHGEAKGAWFVYVNLARDYQSLLKKEVSDWDSWRTWTDQPEHLSDEALRVCDALAHASETISKGRDTENDASGTLCARLGARP